MMRASTVMPPTMTPASLAPLNTGSVLGSCTESGEDDSDALGVDKVPENVFEVPEDADWRGTVEAASLVSSGESGWVTRSE